MTDAPVLSLGTVIGGSSASRTWESAIRRAAGRIIELRAGRRSPLAVNVVFQIPGNEFVPEFEGLRSGQFSRRDRHLLVQVALPPEPPVDADRAVRDLLFEAIALAEEFGRQEAMVDGPLVALRDIVDLL